MERFAQGCGSSVRVGIGIHNETAETETTRRSDRQHVRIVGMIVCVCVRFVVVESVTDSSCDDCL